MTIYNYIVFDNHGIVEAYVSKNSALSCADSLYGGVVYDRFGTIIKK